MMDAGILASVSSAPAALTGASRHDRSPSTSATGSSTPTQIHLAELLGWRSPGYAHVPLVLNHRGDRLAKRDGAVPLPREAAHHLRVARVPVAVTPAPRLVALLPGIAGVSELAIRR